MRAELYTHVNNRNFIPQQREFLREFLFIMINLKRYYVEN